MKNVKITTAIITANEHLTVHLISSIAAKFGEFDCLFGVELKDGAEEQESQGCVGTLCGTIHSNPMHNFISISNWN